MKKIITTLIFLNFGISSAQTIVQLEKRCDSGQEMSCVLLAEKRGLIRYSIQLLTELAQKGNSEAQDKLGSMYGAALERSEAEFWCNKAKEQGTTKCEEVISYRRNLAKQLTLEAIANAPKTFVSVSQLNIGMSMSEVESLMIGRTKKSTRSTTALGSTEDWYFNKERLILRFDDRQHLVAIQELSR